MSLGRDDATVGCENNAGMPESEFGEARIRDQRWFARSIFLLG
jgi:hypothetical protein